MNYPAAMFYLTLAMTLINVVVGISNWWSNRDKVTKARFDAQGKEISDIKGKLANVTGSCGGHTTMANRLDGHNDRLGQHKELIDKLTVEISHLPKNDDLTSIHKRVDAVFRTVDSIDGKLSGMADNVRLLLNHHLGKE